MSPTGMDVEFGPIFLTALEETLKSSLPSQLHGLLSFIGALKSINFHQEFDDIKYLCFFF